MNINDEYTSCVFNPHQLLRSVVAMLGLSDGDAMRIIIIIIIIIIMCTKTSFILCLILISKLH